MRKFHGKNRVFPKLSTGFSIPVYKSSEIQSAGGKAIRSATMRDNESEVGATFGGVTPAHFKFATKKCNDVRAERWGQTLARSGTLRAQTGLLILNRNARDFNGFAKLNCRVILRSRFCEAKSQNKSKPSAPVEFIGEEPYRRINNHETHLATQKTSARPQTRFPRPHEHARWPRHHLAPPRQRPHQIDAGLKLIWPKQKSTRY